ncbi:MAG: fibronectin type III domain-containing protein, partial [Acidobacteria bacterium]|nr:fibronectin type III domain-containing protein [Acidobacteriota bacterium]
YRVRAFNGGGNSGYSNTSTATTLAPPPPATPGNLVATATSSSQISLTWTDTASNEDGFKIERCQGAGCTNFTQIGQVGAGVTSFGNTELAPSTTYVYRVRAFNSGGNSDYSNTAQATTQAAPAPPAAPSNLVATAVSSSQINLSWADNSNNEDGFRVERKTGATGTYVEIGTVTTGVTTYQDTTGLASGIQYFYRVRAYNAVGNSGYSNEAGATTADTVPASPSGLTGSAASSSQVNLAWADNSTNETGFKIERKTGAAGTFAQIATVSANVTTYSDTGLSATTQYIYRVRAYNTVGDSGYSNEANATTLGNAPAAPTGLSATAGNAEVTLSWTASSGATSYKVKRATVSGGPYTTIASGLAATSYTDTTVSNGTTYHYVVSGDCMIAALWVRGASAYGTITPPGGWTLIRNENWAGTDAVITYYKLAGASEPANYTWTFSTSEQLQGGIAAYYNVDQSAPVNVSAGRQAIYLETNIPAPSVTPTVSNTLLLCFFGSYSPGSFTPPSGMTERWDLSNAATNNSFSAADQIHVGTNATGTRTATHDGTPNYWITQTVALKPAP